MTNLHTGNNLFLSLLIKYVYFRYENNFPLAPESSSRTGISLSVKVFIRWVQIQPDISLSVGEIYTLKIVYKI